MAVVEGVDEISFPSGSGRPMRGAFAPPPPGGEPRPGVIVIHEIFGLNTDIREKVKQLAAMGYAAMAPDLYDTGGPRLLCVAKTMRTLTRGSGGAFDDLEAARRWLAAQPGVDGSRMGVIGFCMGGGFALLFAAKAPLGASAVFYGAVPKERDRIEGVCPVIGSYGGRDRVFGPQGARLEGFLSEMAVPHDVKTYPEAGHSFMSPHRGVAARLSAWGPMKVGFNAEAAEDAWGRVRSFFGEHLG